jgi:hypothetical protein
MNLNRFVNPLEWFRTGDDAGSRIFVSYRRDDARGDAGRLTDNLKARFGERQIFRDIEAIEPGVDFVDAINNAVGSCSVLLAIIGPNWLKITDSQGERRLDDPHDFIRLEIGAALQRNISVIPVLVGGASMPKDEDLPPDIKKLARLQARELSDLRWEFDVKNLVERLEKLGIRPAAPRPDPHGGPWWRKYRMTGAAAAALLVIAGYMYSEFEDDIDALFDRSADAPQALPALSSGFPLGLTTAPNPSPLSNEPLRPAADVPPSRSAVREGSPATVQRPLSYRGLDAIGRYPTLVQVFNPG